MNLIEMLGCLFSIFVAMAGGVAGYMVYGALGACLGLVVGFIVGGGVGVLLYIIPTNISVWREKRAQRSRFEDER